MMSVCQNRFHIKSFLYHSLCNLGQTNPSKTISSSLNEEGGENVARIRDSLYDGLA